MQRLRRAGLRLDEEEGALAAYQALSDAEKFEWLESIGHVDGDELRAMIADGRTSAAYASASQDDEDHVDWEEVPDGTVAEVLAWVGDNQHLASAALIAERRRHDPPRKTLTAQLEALLGG